MHCQVGPLGFRRLRALGGTGLCHFLQHIGACGILVLQVRPDSHDRGHLLQARCRDLNLLHSLHAEHTTVPLLARHIADPPLSSHGSLAVRHEQGLDKQGRIEVAGVAEEQEDIARIRHCNLEVFVSCVHILARSRDHHRLHRVGQVHLPQRRAQAPGIGFLLAGRLDIRTLLRSSPFDNATGLHHARGSPARRPE